MSDWWHADPVVAPAGSSGGQWWDKDPVVSGGQQPAGMTAGDVASGAISNFGPSALRFGQDIAQPFIHPIETATALKNVGQGVLEKTGIMSGKEHEPYADAVKNYFADRYGGIENIKRAIASDPVGVAADLSMLFSGGEAALGRLPGVVGKTGEIAGSVGRAVNPLSAPIQALKGAGYGASELIGGLGTHTGGESLRLAAGAGYEGGEPAKAFRENMRGTAPMEDVVTDARNAVSKMREERSAAYRSGMAGVATDPTILDFAGIDKALKQTEIIKSYKGQSLSPSTQGIRDNITKTINDWRALNPADFHTVEGLDALKQKLGDIRDATQYGTPERVIADRVYQGVRKTIIDQAPQYAQVMKGYELASKEIKEIERTLSLNPGASVDTSLRKLQSVLRDNVNTSYGQRRVLADYLVKVGAPNLMERLAGQALKPWIARGLGKLGMQLAAEIGIVGAAGAPAAVAAGGVGAAVGLPAAIALGVSLPAMSPRLMGEAAYFGGKWSRPYKAVPKGTAQAGTASSEVGRVDTAMPTSSAAFAIRKLEPLVDSGEADRLPQLVATTPALRGPIDDWSKAVGSFNGDATPANIAKVSVATRNLVNNLKDVGISIAARDVLAALGISVAEKRQDEDQNSKNRK